MVAARSSIFAERCEPSVAIARASQFFQQKMRRDEHSARFAAIREGIELERSPSLASFATVMKVSLHASRLLESESMT